MLSGGKACHCTTVTVTTNTRFDWAMIFFFPPSKVEHFQRSHPATLHGVVHLFYTHTCLCQPCSIALCKGRKGAVMV